MEFDRLSKPSIDRTVSGDGGVNTRLSAYLIPDNSETEQVNIIVNNPGKRTRREGCSAFGGGTEAPAGLGFFTAAQGQLDFLSGVWGNKLYLTQGNGQWSVIATTCSLVHNQLHDFVQCISGGHNYLVGCSCEQPTNNSEGIWGHSKMLLYDTETAGHTQISLAPHCIASFQNRIFHGENEKVGWTELNELSSYSDGNSLFVEKGVGGRIRAIVPARDSRPLLWVFKEKAIFTFEVRWGAAGDGGLIPTSGDALDTINSAIRPLTIGTGCIATKSAKWVPGKEGADLFFLSSDGVRTLSRADNDVQQGASFPLSYNIPRWMDRINWTLAHKAAASVYDNAYHLAVPMDGARDNSHILRYDINSEAWSLHTLEMRDLQSAELGSAIRMFGQNAFPSVDTSVTEAVTPSESAPYQVFHLLNGNYDPSTCATIPVIPQYIQETKGFVLKDPLIKKTLDKFTFQCSSADTSYISLAYKPDSASWVTLTETYIPGSRNTVVLGIDPLPWQAVEHRLRRHTVSLTDIQPCYQIQFRIADVSGATEVGRPTIYMTELEGRQLTRDYVNDD